MRFAGPGAEQAMGAVIMAVGHVFDGSHEKARELAQWAKPKIVDRYSFRWNGVLGSMEERWPRLEAGLEEIRVAVVHCERSGPL
jgi:hypothetical protein